LFYDVINAIALILLGIALIYWLFYTCEMTFKIIGQCDPLKLTLGYFSMTVLTNMFYFVPKKVFNLLCYVCDIYQDKFKHDSEWVDL